MQVFWRVLGAAAAGFGAYALVLAPSPVHVALGGRHLLVDMRWLGAWCVLVGLVCWTGAAWRRSRKDGRPWGGGERAAAYGAVLLLLILGFGLVLRLMNPIVR